MNAIELLESQHRQVEEMFAQIASTADSATRSRVFEDLADSLAIHAAIEEHQFYPVVKANGIRDLVLESAEEHLAIKRVIADIMKADSSDESYDAKIKFLKQLVTNHVGAEEGLLFPQVRTLIPPEQLEELGDEMEAEADHLFAEGAPRTNIPSETAEAALV